LVPKVCVHLEDVVGGFGFCSGGCRVGGATRASISFLLGRFGHDCNYDVREVVEIDLFGCDLGVFGGVTFFDKRLGDYAAFGFDPLNP
jgi:hypothetical protein